MKNLLRFPRAHQPDVNALSAQLDGRLPAAGSAALDAHVASCDACRAARAGLRATRAALRAMPAVEAPRSFRLRVADTVPAARPSAVRSWAPAAGALAAVVIAVIVGASLSSRGGSHEASLTAKSAPNAQGSAPPTSVSGARSSAGAAIDTPAVPGPAGAQEIAPPAAGASAVAPAADDDAAIGSGAERTREAKATLPFDAASTAVAQDAARPAATATGQLQASGRSAEGDGGNNSTALYVVVIIGMAAALGAAVIGIRWWRRRGVV